MRFFLLLLSAPLWGACATDAKGNCDLSAVSASLRQIMGPVAPLTASPWGYYQSVVPQVMSSLVDTALAHPPTLGTAIDGSGTCTLTDGPSTLQCTGSHFTTQTPPSTKLIVAWNTIDGAGTGRMVDFVSSVTDDTHLTFTSFQSLATPGTNLAVYLVPADTSTYQAAWWQQYAGNYSNSWNYYGVCISIYRHYYTTADAAWLTKARSWADILWQWSSDHGRVTLGQKDIDWTCQYMRALDGHPERMAPLYGAQQFALSQVMEDQTNYNYLTIVDTRERGYMTAHLVIGAIADTTANGGDDAHHSWFCARLAEQIPAWIAHQETTGLVDQPESQWTNFTVSGKSNAPWRSNIWIKAWQMAYDELVITSSAGCNNTTLAATLLPAIQKAVDWVYDWGISKISLGGNGGGHYIVGSPSSSLTNSPGTGTVTVNVGSTAIVGTGTNFTGQLGCNSTKFIFFTNGIPNTYGRSSVYSVTACADATHATITPSFGTYTEPNNLSGSTFLAVVQSATSCASSAPYCEPVGTVYSAPPKGDPEAVRDYPGQQGWMWLHSGDTKYKTRGDDLFAMTFRGPSDGPYGTLACNGTPCHGGPTVDEFGNACGLTFNCKDSLAGSLATPCGNGCGDGPYAAQGKSWGQAMGFLCSSCYLAYRQMDPLTPPPSGSVLSVTGSNKLTGLVKIP